MRATVFSSTSPDEVPRAFCEPILLEASDSSL